MKPPICERCDQRFDPAEGGLVRFAPTPESEDWRARAAAEPGFVGHPPDLAWFCGEHLAAARTFAGLTLGDALRAMEAADDLTASDTRPGHGRYPVPTVPALLLDLDRTLVDVQSFTDYDAAWEDVRELVDPSLADGGPATTWTSATRACMGVISSLADEAAWHCVSDAIERHERAAISRSVPMPDAGEFLAAAAAASRPTAVVTLLPASVARDVLAHHGLDVAVVVGRDPTIRPKPSGDGLREALRLLGCDAVGAVMVGDSTWDAVAARDAGVGFVGVHAGADEFGSLEPPVPVCAGLLDVLGTVGIRS